MATITANYVVNILSNGTVGSESGLGGFTATDQDGASTEFNVGETIFTGGGTSIGQFQGYVVLNGANFIQVQTPTGALELLSVVSDPLTFNSGLTPGSTYNEPLIASDLSQDSVCFAAGTLIATPEGETAVEKLQIGDMVTTAEGRMVPVKWIGRQTVQKFFAGDRARPVRVSAGALGDGLPNTDLVLTADHALILDGLAINAGALVNGTTITLDRAPQIATYYHVETEGHEVILANGAPAETYVDYIQRRVFDNYAEYVDLYGEDRIIAEMPLPRISAARMLPASIRARLAARDVA